jgi:hypothetical protein
VTPPPSATPEPEATEAVIDTGPNYDAIAAGLTGTDDDYRDERWYATTLGIIAAIVVIAAGNLINIVRAFRRRGRA